MLFRSQCPRRQVQPFTGDLQAAGEHDLVHNACDVRATRRSVGLDVCHECSLESARGYVPPGLLPVDLLVAVVLLLGRRVTTWDPPKWPSGLRCRRSFFPKLRLDLKTTIYRPPRAFAKESAAETQKPRNRDLELKIGGGNSDGVLPAWSPSPPTTSPPTP